MPAAKQKKAKPKQSHKYTFDFSLSGLISLFGFSVLIMVWMFILGVLVGRGYKPETFIPQLARILPQDAVQSIQGPAPKDERSETLKPEDLTFYDDLKKGSEPKREPVKKTPVKATPPKPAAQPPVKASPPKPAAQPSVKPASPAPAAASAETGRFRYIYQVAAFKEEDRAVLFRDQILKGGISSYFLKGESAGDPWFRVYVSFDGTPEQTGKLHSELEKMGVKNPLLRSKKPI